MLISNKQFFKKLRLLHLLVLLFMIVAIVYSLFVFNKEEVWGYIIFIVAVYLLFSLFWHLKKYYYIEVDSDSNFLTIKFFGTSFLSSSKHKIRIPLRDFVKYEIIKKGLHKDLILYQQTERGLAKYPPVSIEGLPNKQLKDFIDLLNSITQKRK